MIRMLALQLASAAMMMASLTGLAIGQGGAEPTAQPRVTVQTGVLEGRREGGINIFKNIPYAQPPVGDLRWAPPQAVAPWPGVRNASEFGPSCTQISIPRFSIYFDPPIAQSEDCLSLNVWAPENARNLPVIVWIHGGSLRIGGAAQPFYDGAVFAHQDVVFVSINYRLGALGWMAHPELSAESPEGVSGNYGFLDQIAALLWVQDNISAFGGDPDQVTLMGESAGALSVSYHLISPLSRGLFSRAIIESTNLRAFPRLREAAHGLPSAESTGLSVSEALGAERLSELRDMDADSLTQGAARAGFVSQGVIDGLVLPDQLLAVLERGEQAPVPLLAGFNRDELRTQTRLLPTAPDSPEAYEAIIRCGYGDLADDYLAVYPADDPVQSTLDAFRDTIYGWAGERLAAAQAEIGQPSYLYLFDHCYDAAREQGLCAFHASELTFVFGQVGPEAARSPNWPMPEGPVDQALSDAMVAYWTSFAKTGLPTAPDAPDWAPYSDGQAFMHFSETPRLSHDLFPGMYEVHGEWVRRQREAGEQWFLDVGVNVQPSCET